MHNRILSRSIILNTSEHRSTIKALLVGTLQQELQVTSRQILGGLPKSLATLTLSLPFVPGSPACIKRWRFLARFLSSFAASRTCRFKSERRWRRAAISWCSKAWPAHESCTMLKMMVSCASPHRNNMLPLQIRADPLCDFIPNSFEPRQRFASVRNSPNLFFAAAPLSSPENTIKIVHLDPVLPGCKTQRQSSVRGIRWNVGGNRLRRRSGSCGCGRASSSRCLFRLALCGCHNTYELISTCIPFGNTTAATASSGAPAGTVGTWVQERFRKRDALTRDCCPRIPVASKAGLHRVAGKTFWIASC